MESNGLAAACLWLLLAAYGAKSEVLTPPYFNIAENRYVEATSTCGEDVEEPELYCKLTGTNQDSIHPEKLVIQGQVCDWCNKSKPSQMHPAKYAVDGSENFWMSPPLSRGQDYNQVNFTIILGQEFHVSYVLIKMGNSPRPGVWVLERSADDGKTYKPWQYFADNDIECEHFFGKESLQPITVDDSVTCETTYSKIVPLQGGEIVVSLINQRPSANDFFNSLVLQEFTRATNVRLRFLRAKTLLGHLMSIAREDPSVTRRYFYSIKDISIGGRCRCNGHADVCDETHPTNPYKLLCRCKHNTTGDNCERCQQNMVQKAWQQSKHNKLFVCEACNCHGHTNRCEYNQTVDELKLSMDIYGRYDGGGVCQDCQDNTEGINCEKCRDGYFRPYHKTQNEPDACHRCPCDDIFYNGKCATGSGKCYCDEKFAPPDCDECAHGFFGYPDCKPCVCNINGTSGDFCEPLEGVCPCKDNFAGVDCKQCSLGFYDYPHCSPCECNLIGSLGDECDADTGKCECNSNFGGTKCTECADGYYDFPTCKYCSCDNRGSTENICSKETGECFCKEGYGGVRCDQCLPGYYGFPDCQPCNCSEVGSSSKACDISGKCPCLSSYGGQRCDRCVPGFFNYPQCLSCHCNTHGSQGISCDDTGKCTCRHLFSGHKCEKCEEGRFNFPICEECSCHPAGIIENFPGCGNLSTIGQLCQCKPRVQGSTCDQCRPLYWNLAMSNPHGCQECDCHEEGVVGGINECSTSGQCICKPFTKSRRCDTCIDGMFDLQANNLFGCADCGCDVGGSENEACDKETGQCRCRPRVAGRTCSEPLKSHYYPTLYQFQYEAENGTTPDRKSIRFGSSETIFPGYSWKGYVVFSKTQSDLIHEVDVLTQTIYHMILRYINPNEDNIKLDVSVSQPDGDQIPQIFDVILKPTHQPQFVILPAKGSSIPAPLVLDPGQWNVHIHNTRPLFLDYFVLVPAAYYEGNILVDRVVTPCDVGATTLCKHFKYPSTSNLDHALTKLGFVFEHGSRQPLLEFIPEEYLSKLRMDRGMPVSDKIAYLSDIQPEMTVELPLKKQGSHVLLISYVTETKNPQPLDIKLQARVSIDKTQDGKATLPSCPYTWLCRQMVLDSDGKLAQFDFDTNIVSVTLQASNNAPTGVEAIIAIPSEEWTIDYITPKPVCVIKENQCMETKFFTPLDFKKIEFESGVDAKLSAITPPEAIDKTAGYVYIDKEEPEVIIKGKVPQPGEYVFIIHYYQPDHPEYIMDAVVEDNDQSTKASVIVGHCPSNSGCRTTVNNSDGIQFFEINSNFSLIFKQPDDRSVWFDYLLIVPAAKYNDRLIAEEPIIKSSLYVNECGKNFLYLDNNASDFCKSSVFSVTTAYNEGALQCKCRPEGSQSLQCNQFGGQCECKPHIIGRRCEECKPGYYGYPECRRCDCPALCDEITGDCMCPPRVVGPNCERCANFTFDYHVIVGCEPCDCNPLGVANDLQCDLLEGICTCKRNVEGRKCDKCSAGFFGFPDCEECECDFRGTTDEKCDQDTADCICKKNVDGQACDVCKDGTFNIQAKNPLGCTKCFCFGKTNKCSSSRLYRTLITGMNDWGISLVNMSQTMEIQDVDGFAESVIEAEEAVGVDLTDEAYDNKVVYLVAPEQYLGNRLTAYGGYLRYSLFCTTGPAGPSVHGVPGVILYGASTYLLHFSVEVPSVAEYFNATIEISESNFILPNGLSVTREKIMQVLQDLKNIYIRATYWKKGVTTRLTGVSLDSAKETPSGLSQAAVSVEQCQCPSNYAGLSCEECATGFYRAQTGPFGGYCIPCQCNGHALDCDKLTGKCIDCGHNTEGDHCEKCARGYHGDATVGYPYDCLICACPLPMASNNFADSCDMSSDNEEISCDCKPGYTGYRCQACSNGFYGNPEDIGDTCKPCNCSGNIDMDAELSCDSVSGECKSCLNNAFGAACELCKPWFYGDAVGLKNCQDCDCDLCGAVECNHSTGQCDCKPNVIGEKCDQCELNHYGYSSCEGCSACDCQKASNSKQCETYTGQCSCKPGVTGRTCNKCAPGHWNYTEEGCTKCECKELYSENVDCDAETGQCQCLPGVLGPTCDHCPELTVLDRSKGCLPCDTCVHTLVNDTKELSILLEPFIIDFSSVNSTFYLNQRLNYIDNEVMDLIENVTMLDGMRLDMNPFEKEIESLKSKLKTSMKYDIKKENNKAQEAIDKLVNEVNNLENLVHDNVQYAKNVVRDVAEIADSFETGSGKYGPKKDEFEEALEEAKRILEELENNQLEYNLDDVKANQFVRAEKCLADVQKVKNQLDLEGKNMKQLQDNLSSLDSRIDDLNENMNKVKQLTDEIKKIILKNREAKVSEKFKELKEKEDQSNQMLTEAEDYINNTTMLLLNATDLAAQLQNTRENIKVLKRDLDDGFSKYDDIDSLGDLVEQARDKAEQMSRDVESDIIEAASYNSSAISAYKDIVDTIRDALMAANGSVVSAEKADKLTAGVDTKVANLSNSANIHYNEGRAVTVALNNLEQELASQIEKVKNLNNSNIESTQNLSDIKSRLDKTDVDKPPPDVGINESANELAKEISQKINSIVNNIPKKLNDSKEFDLARKETKDKHDLAQKKLEQAMNLTDNNELKNVAEELKERSDKINDRSRHIRDDLAKLKKQIRSVQELVNTNKLGVRFHPNTTLELRKPESMNLNEINNYISFYFKTEERIGLLFFLGNEAEYNKRSRRQLPTDEFIALEVENGYLKLTVDLGTGSKSIVIDNRRVDDGIWYRVIVERAAKTIKMTLQWEEKLENAVKPTLQEETKDELLEGNATILNLNKLKSKLYVGGIPNTFACPSEVTYDSFDGFIEDITLNDEPIGLWNFVENVNAGSAEYRRDSLENKTTTTGFRFNGDGYVEIAPRELNLGDKASIILEFKTSAEEGLLFLAVKDNTYMSVELRKGQVLFQFDLGEGPAVLTTNKKDGYNTGTRHRLEAARQGTSGILKVNGKKVSSGEAPPSSRKFKVDYIYIGGYPNGHRIPTVTTRNFDGCIDNVQITDTQVDLNVNNKAYGVTPGCPKKKAMVIWFDKGSRGYAGMPASLDDSTMELILRFKTDRENGTLAYLTDGVNPTTLKLIKGQVEFSSGGQTVITYSQGYADSKWHVVMATHSPTHLTLFIDDYESYTSDIAPRPIRILSGSGKLYLGGVPNRIDAAISLEPHFAGCLGQLILNSQQLNLENMTDVSGDVIIGKCWSPTDQRVMPPPLMELPSGIPDIPEEYDPTTTTTTVPTPVEPKLKFDDPDCKLPLYPEASGQKPKIVGYRFGTKIGSRLEYGLMKYGKYQFSIMFDMITRSEEGLIIYASDLKFFDFFTVYLKDRKLHFKIKCGSDEKDLNSDEIPHDEWQNINIIRNRSEIALKINNIKVDSSIMRCDELNIVKPIHVGGINPNIYEKASINSLKDVEMVFSGCLKNFKMGNNLLGEPPAKYGVIPCSVNYEPGVFFSADGGYIKQYEKFKVGTKMTIEMEIKPRSLSGLLLSVHTQKRDYIVLELVNGSVRIAVDNGAGEISSKFAPSDPAFFCDGKWHKIKAVKIKNVVTLAVDNQQAENGQGDRRQLFTATNHPMYIGGRPRNINRGIQSTTQFVGCIRSVKINDELHEISVINAVGNITAGVCPTT